MAREEARGAAMPSPQKDRHIASPEEIEQVEPKKFDLNNKDDRKEHVKKNPEAGPYQVVALQAGFFANVRRVEGDKFSVPTAKELGSWMKII